MALPKTTTTITTSKGTFSGELVAYWQNLASYYRAPDGTVWCYGITGQWVNKGKLTKETFQNNLRGTWVEA